MKPLLYVESILAALLAGLLLILIRPFNAEISHNAFDFFVFLAICIHFLKVYVIWISAPQDERELTHKYHSSWIAYLTVSTVLITGIGVQGFTTHSVDPWLLFALAMLFIGKVSTRIYLEIKC
jgi:hypothetical protein